MILTPTTPDGPKEGGQQWVIVTGPSLEPITLDELKEFGRIDGTSEDTFLTGLITSIREATENYLGRSLVSRTMKLYLDYWPGMIVELPRPPLYSVQEINLLDEDDTETAYDSDNYFVVKDAIPGKVVIKNGCTPPFNTNRYTAGYVVEYTAGYSDPDLDPDTEYDDIRASIPSAIRDAMKLWCMQVYEMREMRPEPPPEAKVMLSMFRVWNY